MAIARAPGQVFFYGEHAVVYGHPALAGAIDLYTEVQAKLRRDDQILIKSPVGWAKAKLSRAGVRLPGARLKYVGKALELVFEELGRRRGLELRITSSLIPRSGLGSSSAVCVATIASTAAALGARLPKPRVQELAFKAELEVQGAASRTGVAISTHGGFLRVQGGEVRSLSLPPLPLVVGYTGVPSDTARMVRLVKELRLKSPDPVNPLLEAIGVIADSGLEALRGGDLEQAGGLMDLNQALLASLGVSSSRLERLVQAARGAGALGAKLTGAGGGGCVIALARNLEAVARAMEREGGKSFRVKAGAQGLVVRG